MNMNLHVGPCTYRHVYRKADGQAGRHTCAYLRMEVQGTSLSLSPSLSIPTVSLYIYLHINIYPKNLATSRRSFFVRFFYEHSDEKIVHEKNNGNMNDNLVHEKLIE